MYKAIFIDVDGTLIRKDHSLSPLTVQTIQKVKEKGYLVVPVSARPLSGMLSIAGQLDLLSGPLASLNGAYISIGKTIEFDSDINVALTMQLHDQVSHYHPTIIYYQKDQWFCERKNYYTDYEQRITSVPITIQPFEQMVKNWEDEGGGPNKVLVITHEDQMGAMRAQLSREFGRQLNIYNSKTTYLEVMDRKASKLNAIQFFMERFGISRREVIAIGDNFNDQEMIEFAGCGIAMGNAPEEIKSIADYVTASNNEDGVSKALIEILQL